jgi:hypothetical protein
MGMRRTFIRTCVVACAVLAIGVVLRAQDPAPAKPLSTQSLPPTTDPKEIVRRALDADQNGFRLARDYTFERREEMKVMGKNGSIKKHEINTYDVTILYDQPYSRRISKNDKPLNEQDERAEQEKFDKRVAERRDESAEERAKRLARHEKQREEERAFIRDVINAYNFRLVGEEQVDGHAAWVVAATPRPDFHPTQPHADILPKLQGKIWVSKQDYGCIKLEATTLDTISWGLFILRIHRGTQIEIDQSRVNDEIWLPQRMYVNASARVGLFSNDNYTWEDTYSDYKKFTSDSRILPGATAVKP